MKGTDHVCSLTPSEFQQLVRDVRVIEASLGTPIKKVVTSGKKSPQIKTVNLKTSSDSLMALSFS